MQTEILQVQPSQIPSWTKKEQEASLLTQIVISDQHAKAS